MIRRLTIMVLGLLVLAAGSAARANAKTAFPMKHCQLPAAGTTFQSAAPAQEALDATAVQQALLYANTHLRASVEIFRNGCLVGKGLADPVTDNLQTNVWSSTKSVVSLLTGIAVAEHKIRLNAPIGDYLPTGTGWGDAAHRAITVRDLLTETAGLQEAIVAEAATIGTDPNIAQEALAQTLTHTPGTHFDYSQRDPDLLAYVLERAVGEDLQTFAQQHLFGPIGIPQTSYFWLRDRAGDTYGYAFLFITPTQFAKLGLLLTNDGVWRGKRIISKSWVEKIATPTQTNSCYGLLFWTNAGTTCTGASIPAAQTVSGPLIGSAPKDLYAMVGALQQNNFMIPSLHMTVTWTGYLGDTAPSLSGLLSAQPASNLYYNFFQLLMAGVQNVHVPNPGPYVTPPLDLDVNPFNYANPFVTLSDVVPSTSCNILVCDGTIPSQGTAQDEQEITAALLADLGLS